MVPYTIVISDAKDHDAGIRGTRAFWWLASRAGSYSELGLYWFLVEYFGRSAVRLLRPSQLLASSKIETEWLFVGLPSSLSKEHLSRIRFRRMAVYDSTDAPDVDFGESDREFLLSETDLCMKTWIDRRWDTDYTVGLLPIKRPPVNKLRVAIRREALLDRVRRKGRDKLFDVALVARPTGDVARNPRVAWLVELKKKRPDLRLWGGLVGSPRWRRHAAEIVDEEVLQQLWMGRRKVGFFEYFAGLSSSKVSLAPRGWAPWSYRHYEAIYARSVVVCSDLSNIELLLPLPKEGVIDVGEGEAIVPAVERALALYEHCPEIGQQNLEHMERWLDRGAYSRSRVELLDRFFSFLPAA